MDVASSGKEDRMETVSAKEEKCRFVLLGKTGSGKSSSDNTILGTKKFKCSGAFSSVTTKCELVDVTLKDGIVVEVLDTPGLCDTRVSDAENTIIITRTVVGMHPGAHAMIYVLKADRFTEEEYSVFKKLEAIFDLHLYDYLIVVITGGDNLEADEISVEDAINNAPKSLRKLLKDCDNRYVVFNNRTKDPAQVDKLLQMVKELTKKNGSKPHYSCDKYKALGEKLENEVKKRVAGMEQELLEKKKAFQDKMAKKIREMDAAVAKKEISEEEAKQASKELERQMQNMEAQHLKELRRKEELVRKELKHKFLSTTIKSIAGASLMFIGAVLSPLPLVGVPVAVAGAALLGSALAQSVRT